MEIRQLERKFASEYAKVIKKLSGRGPLDSKARIVDSIIIFRSRLDLTMLEQTMYKHLVQANAVNSMLREWASAFMPFLNEMVSPLSHSLHIEDIQLSSGVPEGYCICICYLNMDLEKMILTESVLDDGLSAQREALH